MQTHIEVNAKPYTLLDAVDQNRKYPTTFEIPTAEERTGLAPGQIVKLVFQPTNLVDTCPERMWVEVLEVRNLPDGVSFAGELRNAPIGFTENQLAYGDQVHCGPEHVICILEAGAV